MKKKRKKKNYQTYQETVINLGKNCVLLVFGIRRKCRLEARSDFNFILATLE